MIIFRSLLVVSAVLVLFGCSDDENGGLETVAPPEPEFLSISQPSVSLAPDIGTVLNFGIFDLAAEGYEEQEYFLSGTASAFTNTNELQSDGFWEVEPAEQADYTTRA